VKEKKISVNEWHSALEESGFAAETIETKTDRLQRYLAHRLKDGPQRCDIIRDEMKSLGYKENTIDRAMREFGVERCYRLPDKTTKNQERGTR